MTPEALFGPFRDFECNFFQKNLEKEILEKEFTKRSIKGYQLGNSRSELSIAGVNLRLTQYFATS